MLKTELENDKANIGNRDISSTGPCGELHTVIKFSNFCKRNLYILELEAHLKLRQSPNGPL
jgi:hypothetical protein